MNLPDQWMWTRRILSSPDRRMSFGSMIVSCVCCFALLTGASFAPVDGQQVLPDSQPQLIIHVDGDTIILPRDARLNVHQSSGRLALSADAVRLYDTTEFGLVPPPGYLQSMELDQRLLAAIEQLDDLSFEVRERATRELEELDIEYEQYYAAFEQVELSFEQRARLFGAMRARLLQAPRGAIGIQMQPVPINNQRADGVHVVGLIPGLPAERVLQEGDIITHIDDERIASPSNLTSDVQSRRPGERIRLTIERPQRDELGRPKLDREGRLLTDTLQVDLTLGSADMLINPNTGEPQSVHQIPYRRHQEIVEAYARYGNIAREIQLRGEFPQRDRTDAQNDVDSRIENHPFIHQLLEQQSMLREGRIQMTRGLVEHWESRRRVLELQLEQPNLNEAEREFIRKVLQRYVELMYR